jgi:hypothetical protein
MMMVNVNEKGNIEVTHEDFVGIIENLIRISAIDKSEIEKLVIENTDSTPSESTPMSNPLTSRSERTIKSPDRLQVGINNVQVVEVLATRAAELLEEKFKGNFKNKDKKDKSKDKKSDRKSRKDKHEDKNKRKEKNKSRSDSKY